MFVWLDLETTGLDPSKERILEVGIVVTNDDLIGVTHFDGRLARFGHACRWLGSRDVLVPVVRDMHESSGLLDECETAPTTSEVEQLALDFLRGHAVPEGLPLCGSTIGFDRSFLREHMPALYSYFHYRSVDVSALTELARVWYPEVYAGRPGASDKKAHRALPDIDGSIALLKYYREKMFLRI